MEVFLEGLDNMHTTDLTTWSFSVIGDVPLHRWPTPPEAWVTVQYSHLYLELSTCDHISQNPS